MTVARTKIQPPRLRESTLIERPALESRLARAMLAHRLVLVCAAAGYGKTAILSAALAHPRNGLPEGTAVAWISADVDDDPPRLLECLAAALEPHDPPWRTAPEALVTAMGQGRAADRQAIVAEVINTLDACDVPHGVIVVDDLHRVTDPAVYASLDMVLERLTPRWTIVIGTRVEPPLALARLRAIGELAEFRQHDLEFDAAEARAFVSSLGLDPAGADALLQRTRGWAAGLRLAASTARSGVRSSGVLAAADRHVFDFLTAEVLDRLSPTLREFLLRCSVLPELTPSACAAVSGHAQAEALLEEIERRGLFVTVLEDCEPQREPTLRLHDLFRDALAHRLQRERPQELPGLLHRAAAAERDPTRRIGMLLRAGDCDAAAQVLLEHAPELLTEGALGTVQRLLEQFPRPYALGSPRLAHARGLLGWAQWDFAAMLEHMRQAEHGYRQAGEAELARLAEAYQAVARSPLGRSGEGLQRLAELRREATDTETRVVVTVACLWQALDVGSLHRVGPILDELMDRLEGVTELALWYRAHPIPRCNALPGTARALDRYVQQVLRLTADRPSSLRAYGLIQRGWRQAWQGRLVDALASLEQARDIDRWLGEPPNVHVHATLLGAMLSALRGERDQALAAARALIEGHVQGYGNWALWGQLFYAARIAATCEDPVALRHYLDRLAALRNDEGSLPVQQRQLRPLEGHLAWIEGRHEQALALWSDSLLHEGSMDRLGHLIETRLRLAAGLLRFGRLPEAAEAVAPVPTEVATHAGLGGVLMARAVLPELADAPWGELLPGEAVSRLAQWRQLASASAAAGGALGGSAPPPRTAPGELTLAAMVAPSAPRAGLSSRELEVLARMAAGDSNKLIARAFDLSPHTVKRHVANILDKIGVASRGQAAAWYRSADH